MSFRLKYIKYKKKYNELKGGTFESPGTPNSFGMNIRIIYNDDTISNNISIKEYNELNEKKSYIEYFNSIYDVKDITKDKIKNILKKFNLYYKKLYLRGVGIENYPYGIYQLKNFISLSNDYIFLLNNGIIKQDLKLHTLTVRNYKFIEIIRFEKDINDNWVLQDIASEKISDPGYMLKGIFYYPCIGSGIFLHYKIIRYFYNKLDAISIMHEEWSSQVRNSMLRKKTKVDDEVFSSGNSVEPITPSIGNLHRASSEFKYSAYNQSTKLKKIIEQKENMFNQIKKKDIIKNFIIENNFGRFDPSKNIFLSNLDFICNKIKKFNYLNEVGYLGYLFKNFCKDETDLQRIKDKIYELYYEIFSCELTFENLLNYIKIFDEKSKIYEALQKLNEWTCISKNDKKLSDLLNDKDIINLFINRHEYLITLIKNIKDNSDYTLKNEDAVILINNIMIEIYTQIYTANFNQLFIDTTLFYYARKLNIDTVVLLCEPLDKFQNFGSEIISIEDYQLDSFKRTINCAKIIKDKKDSIEEDLKQYLMKIAE